MLVEGWFWCAMAMKNNISEAFFLSKTTEQSRLQHAHLGVLYGCPKASHTVGIRYVFYAKPTAQEEANMDP